MNMGVAAAITDVVGGLWRRSWKADPRAREIADRHYNRQRVGAAQFMPPGAGVVFFVDGAVWITSAPIARFVRHAWAGAWVNSLFRNERPDLYRSSDLIRDAVACSRFVLGEPPALGLVSFVDARQVRRKRDPGRCYVRAGFRHVGFTKGGLYAFQLLPAEFPAARFVADEPRPPRPPRIPSPRLVIPDGVERCRVAGCRRPVEPASAGTCASHRNGGAWSQRSRQL